MQEVFTEDDRHYISLLQENMNRTASARANAKIWLATLATAIAALNFSREGNLLIWIAVVMVVVFYLMDCLYLSLESKYLHLMHTFVDVCKAGDEEKRKAMLYNLDISDIHEGATSFLNSMVSSRTLPYYLILFLIALAISLFPLLS